MRLEHVCDLELAYRTEDDFLDEGIDLVRPYGEEGRAYGEGDGTAAGQRLNGTIRWANFPRRRGDGVFLPNVTGSLHTEDGAVILLTIQGLSVTEPSGDTRKIGAAVGLEAEADQYRWVNKSFFAAEGTIERASGKIHFAVYECINELP